MRSAETPDRHIGQRVRSIAFYLPQFYPIPENDEWWGKGFTEWTNVAKATPLFPGHYQPHIPADLGFYDLRLPEIRAQQARLARQYDIDAFCYYHYWFAGRRILERPFNDVLASREPDFPFCLCWANQTWAGTWFGNPSHVLIEQTYPGMDDHNRHFDYLIQAFTDRRYLRVAGKPLFLIFQPHLIPDLPSVLRHWRRRAIASGLPGLHLVGIRHGFEGWDPSDVGLDACVTKRVPTFYRHDYDGREGARLTPWRRRSGVMVWDHARVVDRLVAPDDPGITDYPCVAPTWDNTPRAGRRGLLLHNSHPDLFRRNLRQGVERAMRLPAPERLLFIKSWNEWAEGNYLEPDLRFGHRWLEAVRDELRPASMPPWTIPGRTLPDRVPAASLVPAEAQAAHAAE